MTKSVSLFTCVMASILSFSFGSVFMALLVRPPAVSGAAAYPDSMSRSRVELVRFKGDDYYVFTEAGGEVILIKAAYGSIPEVIQEAEHP